jgi:hypothetical protein
MLSKIPTVLTAILLTASLLVASVDYAEAKRGRKGAFAAGVALGVLGLSALGANASSRERCYRGPRECRWVRGECYENRFGDVECEGGYRKCERPVYCD